LWCIFIPHELVEMPIVGNLTLPVLTVFYHKQRKKEQGESDDHPVPEEGKLKLKFMGYYL
jgi:hypothetical protein